MSPKQSLPVLLNSRVTIELVDNNGTAERKEFILVPANQADLLSGLLGVNTPMARAILGKHAGEVIPYQVGDLLEVRIISVEENDNPINADAAEKRRAGVKDATNQSEIISQLIFATARGSKWGEYDVDVDKLLSKKEDTGEQENEKPSTNSK